MLIGNLNRHPSYFFQNLAKEYGDIYTFWFSSTPVVIISSYEIARVAFSKNDFSNRCDFSIESQLNSLLMAGHKAFAFMNINEECKLLRKVSVEAIRYY